MKHLLIFALCTFWAFGPVAAHAQAPTQPSQDVAHIVLIWLKQSGNAAHREQVITATQGLADLPGVLDLQVGEVIPSDRARVDDSYDVGLYMRFASQADLQAYLVHPQHQATVKNKLAPLMARYQVFDFALAGPAVNQ